MFVEFTGSSPFHTAPFAMESVHPAVCVKLVSVKLTEMICTLGVAACDRVMAPPSINKPILRNMIFFNVFLCFVLRLAHSENRLPHGRWNKEVEFLAGVGQTGWRMGFRAHSDENEAWLFRRFAVLLISFAERAD